MLPSLRDELVDLTGEERVLLSFRGERDRDLLRSWLESAYEVLEGSPADAGAFDLCMVDERGYEAFEPHLAARREAATPGFLPVLVLATEPRAVPEHADDVVVVPTRTELLASRVESLLRTRRAFAALDAERRTLALYRRAMEEATVGITIALADDDQPLVYANPAFERITGYAREEVLGRNCRFLQGPDTDPEPVAKLREAIDEARSTTVVVRNYRADGTPFWNEVSLTPVGETGDPTHFLGFQQDVTERVERNRRLSVLDRVLRHNLRNKLNVVLANAGDITAEGTEPGALAAAIEAAARDLLDLSDAARRFESAIRPDDTSVRRVDVATHVTHVVAETELTHGVDVSADVPSSAPALAHESLELAVEELLENAVVHGGDPPVVSVSVTDRPDEGVVEIRVADEGPGLPEMERAVLLRGAETPLEHMEGLGLWFVNWTVSASGGTVEVADNEPRGTVVTILLPRA